jgi:polyhydroxybutyrate depolymerase
VPGETTVATATPDRSGRYLEALPSAYDATTPLPLVVDLHGYQESIEVHRLLSNLVATGELHGFVVVVPEADYTVPRWDSTIGSADAAFVTAVLDEVEATRCIDEARVFLAGMSNGAFMTSVMACALSDRIAAAAPVAGIRDPEGCTFARPVPVIAFHGTADTFVAYEGGYGASVAQLPTDDGGTIGTTSDAVTGPSIEQITASWAMRNGCAAGPPAVTPAAADVDLLTFSCPPGSDVELYRITGGGHTWPGSAFSQSIEPIVGHTTMNIDANELMWTFFTAHPLPAG